MPVSQHPKLTQPRRGVKRHGISLTLPQTLKLRWLARQGDRSASFVVGDLIDKAYRDTAGTDELPASEDDAAHDEQKAA